MTPLDFSSCRWFLVSGVRAGDARWTRLVARSEAIGCFAAQTGQGGLKGQEGQGSEWAVILDLEPAGRRQRVSALKSIWTSATPKRSPVRFRPIGQENLRIHHRSAALQALAHAQSVYVERLQATIGLASFLWTSGQPQSLVNETLP